MGRKEAAIGFGGISETLQMTGMSDENRYGDRLRKKDAQLR
jgi:hypothetical protein